ncbi:MAG: ABC transporter ATP-binding protein [Ardenticatenaceae bacterium]
MSTPVNNTSSNTTRAMSAPVTMRGLSKHYGAIKAANDVNLEVKGGQFMTLLGPSGSGKTTTLKMVAGFIEPTAGDVLIDGQVVNQPPHKRDIGMVFQNYALFPHMTAAGNVAFPLRMRSVPTKERDERVARALAMVDLSDRMNQYPKQLSGGQQQRVALARALVFEPRVVLMDEPLGALDKKLRESLQLQIRAIQQNLNITMIYVTHDQEEALVMSDQIAVFNHGRIVQVGTGEELYEEPNSRFVADFIGESNIFEGKLEQDGDYYFKTDQFRFAVPNPKKGLPRDVPLSLVVRPERLYIYPKSTKKNLVNTLNVTVKDVIYLGSERKYELETPDGLELIARHQVSDGYQPRAGDQVIASWGVERGVVVPTN